MHKFNLTLVIISLGLISFLGITIETALNITFPILTNEFHLPIGIIQWLTSGYMLVSTIIIPFGAFLQKKFTNVFLFNFGTSCFFIGSIIASFSPSFSSLLIGRLIQGFSNGIVLPLMFSIILHKAPKEKLGTLMGLGSLTLAFAPAVGPIYGGLIAKNFGWRMMFTIILPIILISLIIGNLSLPKEKKKSNISFDILGGLLLIAFLSLSLVEINFLATKISLFLKIIILLLILLIGILFYKYESNCNNIILNLGLFKNPSFVLLLSAFFLLQLSSLSMSYLIPYSLQMIFKINVQLAGLMIAPAAFINGFSNFFGGKLYDKYNHYLAILTGSLIIIVTFLFLSLVNPYPLSLIIAYSIFMIGLGISYSNIMTLSLSKLPKNLINDGNAIFMTSQSYSAAMGITISASLMSFCQNNHANIINTSNGLHANVLYLFVVSLIILILLLKEKYKL